MVNKKKDILFCDIIEYENTLIKEEPQNIRKFANIHERINDKVRMRVNYKKWYPSLLESQIDILINQYFYVFGQESTYNNIEIKERVPAYARRLKK